LFIQLATHPTFVGHVCEVLAEGNVTQALPNNCHAHEVPDKGKRDLQGALPLSGKEQDSLATVLL